MDFLLLAEALLPLFIYNIVFMAEKNKIVGGSKPNYSYALAGLAKRVQNPNGTWSFKILWGRVFIAFILFMALLWVAISSAIYCIFKYGRDYDEMTFYQALIAPLDMQAHRERIGEYNARKAKEYIKERKYREAYMSLANAVGRSPKNIEARQMLAEFNLSFGRPDIALEIMEVGLIYATENTKYIRLYMRLLIDQNEDKRLVLVAERLLSKGNIKNPEVVAYLAMSLSSIYALHGNYDKSKEYLVKYKLDKTLPGILRLSKNEWEQGNRDAAIKVIADNFDYAHNKEPLYSLLVNYYTVMKDLDKARQYSMLRSIENPFSLEQRMEYLNLLKKSGDVENLKADLDKLFNQYKNNNKGMLYLANYAADNGDVELMRKIYDTAITNNFSIAPYCLLSLETMLTNGEYKAASDFAEEILKDKPMWIKRYEDVLSCLRAIAYYGIGNNNMADILLRDVVKRGTCSPKVLVATARRLDNLGGTLMAHRLLENTVDRYPRHQLALARLVQMEIKIGNSTNLEKHVLKLLQMRRPSRELIEDARRKLASDRFIFTRDRGRILAEIDGLIKNNTSFDLGGESESDRITDSDEPLDF